MIFDEPANSGLEGLNWDDSPDLTAVSEEDLALTLGKLAKEERDISYRRRILQGRIDLIRVELVRRGEPSLSPEDLARIMLDTGMEKSEAGEPEAGGAEV